ncbi:MAG TPA: hypothetical protein DHU55_05940 [Blastocatellia bacterium]|jgi:hypothetical protein|nr:hypothetical protein [Blastocatellia bacterium]HAF25221.1 hypothetical protein [Blastocatellia bacterium]HCX29301.1 hypothetical protein [Blastocatellia bacterium]
MRTRIREARRSVKEQVGFDIEIDFVPAPISDIGIDGYQVIQAETSDEDPNHDFFLWHLGRHQQDFATPEEATEAFVEAWFKFGPPLSLTGLH